MRRRLFPLDHALGYATNGADATLSIYNATGILIDCEQVNGTGSKPMPHPGIYVASLVSALFSPATLKFAIK